MQAFNLFLLKSVNNWILANKGWPYLGPQNKILKIKIWEIGTERPLYDKINKITWKRKLTNSFSDGNSYFHLFLNEAQVKYFSITEPIN